MSHLYSFPSKKKTKTLSLCLYSLHLRTKSLNIVFNDILIAFWIPGDAHGFFGSYQSINLSSSSGWTFGHPAEEIYIQRKSLLDASCTKSLWAITDCSPAASRSYYSRRRNERARSLGGRLRSLKWMMTRRNTILWFQTRAQFFTFKFYIILHLSLFSISRYNWAPNWTKYCLAGARYYLLKHRIRARAKYTICTIGTAHIF